MAAVAPLPRHRDASEPIGKIRPRDLRRKPLERRPLPKGYVPAPGSAASVASHLSIVPRRRRTAWIVVSSCVVLFALCLGAVAFQTGLARNQLELDRVERAVRDASERYDMLRQQRAELRSPRRLAFEAERLGMRPAENGEFMIVGAEVVAAVNAAAADLPADISAQATPFDQYAEVKSLTGDVP